MGSDDNITLVDKLIEFIEEGKLNKEQKKNLLKAIYSIEEITKIQIDRFALFYGLEQDRQKFVQISKIYKCSSSAIRGSVVTVRNKLSRYENVMQVVKKIVNQCEKIG